MLKRQGPCACVLSGSVLSDSCDPMDCSPPGSSVCGTSQARILEWVAIPFPRGSSRPGITPASPALPSRYFTAKPLGNRSRVPRTKNRATGRREAGRTEGTRRMGLGASGLWPDRPGGHCGEPGSRLEALWDVPLKGGARKGHRKGTLNPEGREAAGSRGAEPAHAQRRSGRQGAGRGAEPGREPRDTGRAREGAWEEAGTRVHDDQRHGQPGGSAERGRNGIPGPRGGGGRRSALGVWSGQPFRAWEAGTPNARRPGPGGACRPCAQPHPGLLEGRCPVLTGTMSPCQVSKLASSTWMLRKFFIPHLRISSSSCWLTKHRGVSHGGRHHGLPLLTPSN